MAPSPSTERRLLQVAVAAAGFVPVGYGLAGAILGGAMTGEALAPPALDSQLRDLSGVLLGLGLAFWEALPQIERRGPRIRLLTLVMMLGGVIRLTGFGVVAYPGPAAVAALVMELGIFPLLCLWQARVARRCGWAG